MKTFLVVAVGALVFYLALRTEEAAKLLISDRELGNMVADSLADALAVQEADVDAGMAYFARKNHVAGRDFRVNFDAVGDLGWPTVVRGWTVEIFRDKENQPKQFHYWIGFSCGAIQRRASIM